jgi:hypothetical protein
MIVARAADGQGDGAPGTLLSVAAASMRRQPVVAVA